MPITCPNCGGDEFEKRGQRRVYARLDDDLEIDGWEEADADTIVWDHQPAPPGDEYIYCLGCDGMFTEAMLIDHYEGR